MVFYQDRKMQMCDCICDCGKEIKVTASNLTRENGTQSCGCSRLGKKTKNLVGQRFGRLIAVKQNLAKWKEGIRASHDCICDCGNEVTVVNAALLKENGTRSCGCLNREILLDVLSVDVTGQRFGRLVAIERIHIKNEPTRYKCICDCGNTKIVSYGSLAAGTQSCGCLRDELIGNFHRTHTGEDSPTWRGGGEKVWYNTYAPQLEFCEEVRRCPDDPDYLEVKCTYCGKWIMPTKNEVSNRVQCIKRSDGSEKRFYCPGDGCRSQCSIYYQNLFPKGYKPATSREVQPELRQLCFLRDDYTCQRCGSKDNLHCHHIEGININPLESADIDLTVTVCKDCHKWIHKQKDCRYIDLQCKKDAA